MSPGQKRIYHLISTTTLARESIRSPQTTNSQFLLYSHEANSSCDKLKTHLRSMRWWMFKLLLLLQLRLRLKWLLINVDHSQRKLPANLLYNGVVKIFFSYIRTWLLIFFSSHIIMCVIWWVLEIEFENSFLLFGITEV